ncbi:MAG: hypothetical protein JO316_23740 [Abitibacteriaceae bacterium]|nr:hypothetical protein [Abditibacteriaceae bacterium]
MPGIKNFPLALCPFDVKLGVEHELRLLREAVETVDIYIFCLLLGFVGLVAMAFSGLGHHGAGGHAHGGHIGHGSGAHALGHGSAHGHALHGPAGHAAHGQGVHTHGTQSAATHGHQSANREHGEVRGDSTSLQTQSGSGLSGSLMAWLSPRVIFSVILGFGATGMLIHQLLHEPTTMALALVGGWGFERLLVSPVWNLLLGFASNPARTLEDAVAEEARAATDFDASGSGLIALDLDGQVVQVLGTLRSADRAAGVRVRTGDRLFVESVDNKRNSCVVSSINNQGAAVQS